MTNLRIDVNKQQYSVHVHLFINCMSYLCQNGKTALHLAAKNNNTDIALLLIEHGCSVDVKNNVSSYRLQYQLTKPLMVVVHKFTYLQSTELASTQLLGKYLLRMNKLMVQKQTRPTCIFEYVEVGEQTCPQTTTIN